MLGKGLMRVRGRSDDGQVVRWSGEHQVNVKSQSELDIGGHETCILLLSGVGKNKK